MQVWCNFSPFIFPPATKFSTYHKMPYPPPPSVVFWMIYAPLFVWIIWKVSSNLKKIIFSTYSMHFWHGRPKANSTDTKKIILYKGKIILNWHSSAILKEIQLTCTSCSTSELNAPSDSSCAASNKASDTFSFGIILVYIRAWMPYKIHI